MEGVCREVIGDYSVAPMASGRYFPQPTADLFMCDCDRRLVGARMGSARTTQVHLSSCQTSMIFRTGLIRRAAAVVVVEADDVVLAEIAAGLHLDEMQRLAAFVLEPVRHLQG